MKKYKYRIVKNIVALGLVAPILVSANVVNDYIAHTHLVTILNTANDQLSRLDEVSSSVSNASNMLGNVNPDSPLAQYSSQIAKLMDSSLSLSGAGIWSMQNVAANPTDIDNWRSLRWSAQEVGQKLYHQKNEQDRLTYQEIDRVNLNRHEVFEDSTKNGMALAETRQATVKETQEVVVGISQNAAKASNLHEDLEVNNQALIIIANESVQIRQLLAKQLELMSVLHMKVYSANNPPAKLHTDPKEEAAKERAWQKRRKEMDREIKAGAARMKAKLQRK